MYISVLFTVCLHCLKHVLLFGKNAHFVLRFLLSCILHALILNSSFSIYPYVFFVQAFIDLYRDVLCIADNFLRSPEIAISSYGSKVYEQAFVNLDTYCQQVGFLSYLLHF